ncbi:Deoxyhypusine hydroxylase [Cucumispora dikerogammari]|nr:Deoxyhypusine hydroxylase [Cucumispora dikerogammari]
MKEEEITKNNKENETTENIKQEEIKTTENAKPKIITGDTENKSGNIIENRDIENENNTETQFSKELSDFFFQDSHSQDEVDEYSDWGSFKIDNSNIDIHTIIRQEKETSPENYIKIQEAYLTLKRARKVPGGIGKFEHNTNLLKTKIRTINVLRNINCSLSVLLLIFLLDKEDPINIIPKHRIAYSIGQMRNPISIPFLLKHLVDEKQDSLVRHDCAEALGNFNIYYITLMCKNGINIIEGLIGHPIDIISESCYLTGRKLHPYSLNYMVEDDARNANMELTTYLAIYEKIEPYIITPISPFKSYDPAISIGAFHKSFFDDNGEPYMRYQIMFYLRNLNNTYSVEKLGQGFKCKSKIFRHKIAFVLGQMKNTEALPILEKVVSNEEEIDMVRQEALSSIGLIGGSKAREILKKFIYHKIKVLRDSATIGLDI